MSSIVNKIKEKVHSDNKAHHGAPEGTHGPHDSRVANAADPRVDSDRDGSHTAGRTAGHGEYGSGLGTGSAEGAHGPHNSRIANAADPRVDSDRDGSKTVGNTHSTGRTSGGTAEGLHGPHNSRIANAADPRVDSDRDGSNTLGNSRTTGTGFGSGTTGGITGGSNTHSHHAGSGLTGLTGTHGDPTGTHGPHNSRVANAADPRVDSDRDGRGALHTGPGPAPNTAGPHNSDMANKLDPRVDSDLDGSNTVGGNKTYQSTTTNSTFNRDPTDAAQVPPSVLRKYLGDPVVTHDDHTHHRERRNSVKSHQEAFSGI